MHATTFLVTVVDCHIIAAALNHLKMPSVSDEPSHDLLTESVCLKAKEKRSDILETVNREIVLRFIDTKPGLSDHKSRKSKKNKDTEKEGTRCMIMRENCCHMVYYTSVLLTAFEKEMARKSCVA